MLNKGIVLMPKIYTKHTTSTHDKKKRQQEFIFTIDSVQLREALRLRKACPYECNFFTSLEKKIVTKCKIH